MNHTLLQIPKMTIMKTLLVSILCLQINFIDCTNKRSQPFTNQEREQLIKGFNNALAQSSDLDDANLELLEQVIQYKKTYGKIILDYLVSHYPANYDLINYDGTTLLLEAARAGNLTLLQSLLKVSAANNPNNQNVNKLTLQAGENINYQRRSGATALHFAAQLGHDDIANLLITYGANINIQDNWGWTPLHRAMNENHCNLANLLINHNAEVNIQDKWGRTPLHSAVEYNSFNVVQLLILHGANPHMKNDEGKTALSLASPEMQKVIEQALAE